MSSFAPFLVTQKEYKEKPRELVILWALSRFDKKACTVLIVNDRFFVVNKRRGDMKQFTVNYINPEYIKKYGRCAAMLINRIDDIMKLMEKKDQGKIINGKRFFYHTAKQFSDELCYSDRQIKRCIKKLRELKIIETKKLSDSFLNHTLFFWISPDFRKGHDVTIDSDMASLSIGTPGHFPLYNKERYIKKERGEDGRFATPIVNPDDIEIWNAYSEAYEKRYCKPPIKTSKAMKTCKSIRNEIGLEKAKEIVVHYLKFSSKYYCQRGHALEICFEDIQQLETHLQNYLENFAD